MNKNIFIKIISRIKKIFFANSMPCEKPYMEENMEQSNLLLILNLTRREKSKDSSRALTKLTIKNREIDYSYYRGGRHTLDKKKQYKLDENQEIELIEYIKENKLNRNIKEKKSTDGYGISIDLSLEIEIEDTKTKVKIIGRKNIWGKNDGKETNLKNVEFYNEVHSLIVFLKNKFDFDFEL